MQKEEIKKLLHNFWQRSSDACPLEAAEAEYQEKEFEKYVESIPQSPEHTSDREPEGIDDLWRDLIKDVEDNQFLSTKYKETIDKLKSKYHITRK